MRAKQRGIRLWFTTLLNNAFIRKSTTYYTLDSVEGSPYTFSSDGRTGFYAH
jgi:hypothetical protein